MRLVSSTRISSFAAGRSISVCRHSCVMFLFAWPRLASPVIAIKGIPAFKDSASAVARLVAPGPSVASQMPGRLVTRA